MKDYEKLSKEHFNKQASIYDEKDTLYLKRRPREEPVRFVEIHPQAQEGLKLVNKILFVEVEGENVRREFFAFKEGVQKSQKNT